jgi:predicted nucleotidyltransferase
MAAHLAAGDVPITYSARFGEYALKISDGGSAKQLIEFCPWCGRRLPESMRNAWFEQLERLGLNPEDPAVPEWMKSDVWWRSAAPLRELLSEHMPEIRRRFEAQSLAVFGSVARNESRADSDLDVLVEFAGRPTFDNYMGLKLYLEELFGVAVDLAIPSDLRPALRPRIEQEALRVS